MTTVTSNGRVRQIECDQLVIPGKCIVDFQELTVRKVSSSSPEDIDPRLAILLDIFYVHHDQFLTLEQLADLQYGYTESGVTGSIKADIGKLRALIGDQKPFSAIVHKSGKGYKFVYGEKSPAKHLTLETIFKRLSIAGEINVICVVSSDGTLIIETTAKPSANVTCDFLMPDSVFALPLRNSDKEEFVYGKIKSAKQQLQNFYWHSAMLMDKIWDICHENVRERLIRIQKLKGITAFSAPLPHRLEDLDAFPLDANKMLDLILEKLILEIEKMIFEPTVIQSFFSNTKVVLSKTNAIDGIVASSLIAMYFLSFGYNPELDESFLRDADRYKSALQKKIRETFFSETSPDASDLDVFIALCKLAKEAMSEVLSDLDDKRERMKDFDKVFVEKLNLSEILRNSGIRLSDTSNTSENQSPIKSR